MRLICILLSLGAVSPAIAQTTTLEFRDIREIRSSAIATRAPFGPRPIVTEPQSDPGTGRGAGQDASLGPAISRLGLDAQALLDAATVPVGVVVAAGSPLVEFGMGDLAFGMAIVERVVDPDFDAVHYALVDPLSEDYARLTVALNGPEIVGTVFLDRKEYRILPAADGRQLVHPVTRYRGEFRSSQGPRLETRAGRLEARHLQQAWAAERRPEVLSTEPDGRLRQVRVGADGASNLGLIDIHGAMRLDADGKPDADVARLAELVAEFINDIRHITLIDEPIAVRIVSHEIGPLYEGVAASGWIRFAQVIDGVPVDDESSLDIDRGGNVTRITSDLMRPAVAERGGGTLLTGDQAESRARAAVLDRFAVDWPLQLRDRELLYEYGEGYESLFRLWRLSFSSESCRADYRVEINALSGEIVNASQNPLILGMPQTRSGEALLADCRN